MRILVVGATGFVGRRLVGRLAEQGHEVVAFSRSASNESFPAGVETVAGDLSDGDSVAGLCDGIDVAYYLIHSLTAENFAAQDREYARRFRRLTDEAGLDRVIYLSGISGTGQGLSEHLESRREVEVILDGGDYDLTVLRAAVIIGAGSASFQILHDLTDRLPLMLVPQWVRTPCQPIGIRDAISYLVGVLDVDETRGKTYDIGGPSVWSYESLLELTAEQKGKHVKIVPVPVMTPKLSSYWLRLTTEVPFDVAQALAEGMRNPVVVDETMNLQSVVPIDQTAIETAVSEALAELDDR